MKRRLSVLLSVLLVLTLVMTGCRKKPKDTYADELNKVVQYTAGEIGKGYSKLPGRSQESSGYDISIDLSATDGSITGGLFSAVGAEIELEYNGKDTQAVIKTTMDKNPLVTAKAIVNNDMIYFTLPDFTSEYLGIKPNITGLDINALPTADEIKGMVKDYGTRLATAFKYDSRDKKANIDVQGIHFKATKYTGIATTDELKTITDKIVEDFKASKLYKALSSGIGQPSVIHDNLDNLVSEEDKTIKLSVYIGKDKHVAYELEGKDSGDKIGYITDGNNWTVYTIESGVETSLAHHKVVDGTNGKNGVLYIGDKESNIEIKYTEAVKNEKGKITSCKFIIRSTAEGITSEAISGSYKDEGQKIFDLVISNGGKQVANVQIKITERTAKSIEIPAEYFDGNNEISSWMGTMDNKKLEEFGGLFNSLTELINNFNSGEGESGSVINPEDKALEDFQGIDGINNKSLGSFKGYNANDDDIWIELSEEEVLEAGTPSTAVRVITTENTAIADMEKYIEATAFAKDTEKKETKSYVISGKTGNLKSAYTRTVTYYKDDDNFINIGYEAVTGGLSCVMVRASDLDNAVEITQGVFDRLTGNSGKLKLIDNYTDGFASIYEDSKDISAVLIEGVNYNETKYYTGVVN